MRKHRELPFHLWREFIVGFAFLVVQLRKKAHSESEGSPLEMCFIDNTLRWMLDCHVFWFVKSEAFTRCLVLASFFDHLPRGGLGMQVRPEELPAV